MWKEILKPLSDRVFPEFKARSAKHSAWKADQAQRVTQLPSLRVFFQQLRINTHIPSVKTEIVESAGRRIGGTMMFFLDTLIKSNLFAGLFMETSLKQRLFEICWIDHKVIGQKYTFNLGTFILPCTRPACFRCFRYPS